ncbi:MAG: hypothetical protein EBZ78_04120 [Verrucomicrobia bacterium]|nr:hypothetical protein [Verrucomicrobiota bacterium]
MKAPNPAADVNKSRTTLTTLRNLIGPDAALIPVDPGKKKPALPGWQTLTCTWSADPAHEARLQTGNVGVNLGAASGGLVTIDCDDDRLAEEMMRLNPILTRTLTSKRSRGCNFWLRLIHPWPTSTKLRDDSGQPVGEWRADGNQTVIAGEAEGVPYTITNPVPVQVVDFHELRWPARIREIPDDPARLIVEAEKGEFFTTVQKKEKDGTIRKEVRANTVPIAFYVARRARIMYEADTKTLWQYRLGSGAWQRITKNRVKAEAEMALAQIAELGGIPASQLRNNSQLGNLAALVEMAEERLGNPFDERPHRGRVIHAANAMLVIDGGAIREERHAPEFLSRHPSRIPYRAEAKCDRFLEELMRPMFTPEDLDLVQRHAGACLLHHNAAQQFLLMRGPGGCGKGTYARILERVVGSDSVMQLRTEHLGSRFEINQCAPYSLLCGHDVPPDFLEKKGIPLFKAMIGGDSLKCEAKGENHPAKRSGTWNALVISNHRLRVLLQGDTEAWRRRLAIVDAKAKDPDRRVIPDLEAVLLAEEAEGILAWMVEGAVRHVEELEAIGHFELSAAQRERVENLLAESESAKHFVRDCVERCQNEQLTSQDAQLAYREYAEGKGWELPPDENQQKTAIKNAMLDVHRAPQAHDLGEKRATRGWRNFKLRPTDPTGETLP